MDLKNQTQKRTIKFRGKNLKGQWHYGLLCHDKTKDSDYEWFISNSAGKPYAFWAIPETIGQFTGLHDKNGKEIYEGDMIRDDYTDEDILIEYYSVVVWDGKSCQWAIDNSFAKDGSSFTNLVEYFGRETLEIIGNVFENPDLVKL